MEGCFCVYVVKTTNALVLFFKQRNLERETRNMEVTECKLFFFWGVCV